MSGSFFRRPAADVYTLSFLVADDMLGPSPLRRYI